MRRRHGNLPVHNNEEDDMNNTNRSRTTKTSNRVFQQLLQAKSNKPIVIVLLAAIILVIFFARFLLPSKQQQAQPTTTLPQVPVRTELERLHHVEQNIVKDRNKYIPIGNDDDDTYDIFHCPWQPPLNYPRDYPVMDVLNNWPIDDVTEHSSRQVHQGVCVFDFGLTIGNLTARITLEHQIRAYQRAEVPFVIRNDNAVLQTVERWNHENYMFDLLQGKTFRGERSPTNHMMYWNVNRKWTKVPPNFQRPTQMHPYTYAEWHKIASQPRTKDEEHAYIRMDACEKGQMCDSSYRRTGLSGKFKDVVIDNADFWLDEMPFFNPNYPSESDLYVIQPKFHKGIQCRFGMAGLIAENHFDSDRNFVGVFGGERRYILGHPQNCPNMYLYEMHHPMERHSQIDWSTPDLEKYPNFSQTQVNEVVLQAGDILYLPTQW
eukprot:CAMPEP_0178930334 /NCGR_PEP_ID=MMETSP0786-20121207/21162_1 /TAXON_ID=186022 /ORGANISM="Thalassionema frauenfeldii, Strain CCMP 1798" /LENGTH=432 /DNA_ID=CAMNT_0020606819 /DNA_START=41 /DNA_END=1336 /DNA_ORIENTATION=-